MTREEDKKIVKPVLKEQEAKVILVNGEGCKDDCEQFFNKSGSSGKCGWRETDKGWALW